LLNRKLFFSLLCVCALLLVGGAAFSDTCDPGEYMVCSLDPQYGSECNDCGCAHCPPGYTSDGTGLVTYCPNQYGDSGCYIAPVLCQDYTLTCPSDDGSPAWTTIKCKVVADNCNGVSGCTKYEACNSATGNVWPDLSSNCHLENGTCYGNTRACKEFTLETENNDIDCQKASQQGHATWEPDVSAWDTSDCYCKIEHGVIGTGPFGIPFWCDDMNANYVVSPANMYRTTLVSANIIYTMERVYCAKCHPGYLPFISVSPNDDGIELRPGGISGDWGVGVCAQEVPVPYYADGCVIDFSQSTGQAAIEAPSCRKSCPSGHGTNVNGATSMSQCVSTGEIYEDSTGTFILGSDLCQ